jgi:hypothetical protein
MAAIMAAAGMGGAPVLGGGGGGGSINAAEKAKLIKTIKDEIKPMIN